MASARGLFKSCLGLVAGNYAPYRIFSLDLRPQPFVLPVDPSFELRTIEDRRDTIGIEAFIHGERAGSCWIWYGERYRRERNFWPLGPKEAKLVHIETNPALRGRGVAVKLLVVAGVEMRQRGFERLYARIWHNNSASIRAFEKAGWQYHHFVFEFDPMRLGRRVRVSFKGSY